MIDMNICDNLISLTSRIDTIDGGVILYIMTGVVEMLFLISFLGLDQHFHFNLTKLPLLIIGPNISSPEFLHVTCMAFQP